MHSPKKALFYAASAVAIVAIAMVAFYYFSERWKASNNQKDLQPSAAATNEEKSEFVGMYSPSDGPLEAEEKRIALFIVNQKEEGGYLGSAKVNPSGAGEPIFFNCVEVRIEEAEFFLSCFHESEGAISLNGRWQKNSENKIQVAGKVLWVKNSKSLLEVDRTFDHLPEE